MRYGSFGSVIILLSSLGARACSRVVGREASGGSCGTIAGVMDAPAPTIATDGEAAIGERRGRGMGRVCSPWCSMPRSQGQRSAEAARLVVRRRAADALYRSSPPVARAAAGRSLSRRLSLPLSLSRTLSCH
eukprot:scaffold251700_cov32-Tisochrysis_lutea.AAC.3